MPGVYVHIPYCRSKCFYCDFYSVGSKNAPWHDYVSALLTEAKARRSEFETFNSSAPLTLYIGGGTPSQMPTYELERLIDGLRESLSLTRLQEFTVELNPEDVTAELAASLLQTGVNRVSMGIQTFDDAVLKAIGRRHSSATALNACSILRNSFSNISIDLMFGLPLQTMQSWEHTLRTAINLNPEHISAYSLMWEERTALYKMLKTGRIEACEEDLNEEMFLALTEALSEAGYQQYEISNYCKSGFKSVHNSSYWSGEPYLGLGPAAHSYDGSTIRRANPADIKTYIKQLNSTGQPLYSQEILTPSELREEYIMTRLRCCEGINLSDYAKRFGQKALNTLIDKAKANTKLLKLNPTSISLTHEAIMISDTAILALI
ncbi:MAG: radical SAM family heme chaperone HemW [Prevotella sp.]|nr:radical SAM family heme chaperone HemW [Prevotella sp.]MCM1074477.1 radical SAM family heme chaperone HemW [Ruminococcus sp.]